jgi:hypothetical protein
VVAVVAVVVMVVIVVSIRVSIAVAGKVLPLELHLTEMGDT